MSVRPLAALLFASLACATGALMAQPLVWRGDTSIDLIDMDARMARFPESDRAEFSRDPANLARLMDQLLVNRGLAAEARELGLDKDPAVSRDLELAVEEVLAIHRLNRLLDSDNLPDFEPLARERYLADPSAYHRPESRVVEHVLISTSDRSDEEALQLAEQVREEAGVGASFLDLIVRYSDDPGKTNNQGRYTITDPTKYQPEFSAAAIGLSKPGDISAPIRTTFGYHIIKLVSVTPAETLPFERVREDLIRNIANEYRKNVRSDHLTQIRAKGEGQGDEELLLTLPYRYGGRTEAPGAGNSSGD